MYGREFWELKSFSEFALVVNHQFFFFQFFDIPYMIFHVKYFMETFSFQVQNEHAGFHDPRQAILI